MSTVTAAKSAVQPRAAPASGYVVWEGRSRHNGKPIVVIITGLVNPSENPKTGPMAQVWVLPRDTHPAVAVTTGEDESVCNRCPFRAAMRRARRDTTGTACYVTVHRGPGQVWHSYRAGLYARVGRHKLAALLRERRVRGGAYGNLSNAPLWVSRIWADHAQRHTQYDHNWAHCDPGFATLAMASVGTVAEKEQANALGWRTFRVKQPGDPVLPDERECPAQDKFRAAGKLVTCFDCGACHGTRGVPRKVNIVVDDHGPTSALVKAKRAAARFALPTL